MPSFQFQDSDNKTFEVLPPGDYIAEVKGVEFGISRGAKTGGSDDMTLKLAIDDHPGATIEETLIFHESCGWKIDTFVKSMNLLIGGKPPAKGDPIEFTEPMVKGLRGWVTVKNEPGRKDPTKLFNRIAVFITNKEKLVKRVDLPSSEELPPF
jgi:hypothetical protein